ncbi:MAG: TAT-translocated F420-dependent dehydrogenase, family [Rhodospirillales bacterium]|nr:TAT-translocated F420-dependent dehydrogenase, family [Rhodospirillales bacterium]
MSNDGFHVPDAGNSLSPECGSDTDRASIFAEPSLNRRLLLKSAIAATIGAEAVAGPQAAAQRAAPGAPVGAPGAHNAEKAAPLNKRTIGFMLGHEQFTGPQLLEIGESAARAGFGLLATSDHFQPWQTNEGHSGLAWVTMGALGARSGNSWIGTTVTCPTLRYNPAVVAEAFASLSLFYPGRVFLGVGSGEALNELAATGQWPKWQERWDRLIEAIGIIRALWTGEAVHHKGKYYTVDARLYDPPAQPIPLLTAANAKKSMRLAGRYGEGLVTDPETWKQYKAEWEGGAREVGKNPADMPVLIEQYAVVGDANEARAAAELWRFGPKAFKGYQDIPDPGTIQQRAHSEIPLEKVLSSWAIGSDPAVHIQKLQELFDSGATIVNIHTGQADQKRLLDFYGTDVLPKFK